MYILQISRFTIDEKSSTVHNVERYRLCSSEQSLRHAIQTEIGYAAEKLPVCSEPELLEVWYSWLTGSTKELVDAWNSIYSEIRFGIIEVEESSETEELEIPSAISPFSRCVYTSAMCRCNSYSELLSACNPVPWNEYTDTLRT